MSAWLHRQRKGDLQVLAREAGIKDSDDLLKDDLISTLDEHLRMHAPTLQHKSVFQEFFDRRGSPVKKERNATAATADADGEKKEKKVRRRTTKVKDELESLDEGTPDKAVATRTPRAVQRVAARVPLPPSPAVVTDAIDRQTTAIRAKVGSWWSQSGVTETAESVREALSSVVGVEAAVLLIEAWGLQRETLPWRYAFDLPATAFTDAHAIFVPDFFLLVTHFFWSASTLWAATSLFIPLLFAYFFNFTLKGKSGASSGARAPKGSYKVDPLTFNVSKALVSYLVYAQNLRFWGLVGDHTVLRVDSAIPGGYKGVLIGAGIGALSSVYDAVLKK